MKNLKLTGLQTFLIFSEIGNDLKTLNIHLKHQMLL